MTHQHTDQTDTTVRVPLGKGGPLREATFLGRPNQFTLELELDGQQTRAAMADRGRLIEVLTPGRTILVEHRPEPGRKTAWQALAARMDGPLESGQLISLDTHLPNRLVRAALASGALDELPAHTSWRAEQRVGGSRFDFALDLALDDANEAPATLLLEVKSIGRLDLEGASVIARFPDAPTTRGARHVRELTHLHQEQRHRCAVLFIIQGDADHAEIDDLIDPDLHEALVAARAAGVLLLARACPLTSDGETYGLTLGPLRPLLL